MKKTTYIYIGAIIVIVIGLVVGSRYAREAITYWKDTRVACLSNGHQLLELHIHPVLSITVDGLKEVVPGNIGIVSTCMAEVHTHDTTGIIHVESISTERANSFTLADFFSVWDKSFERDGYRAEIKVNGVTVDGPESVSFRDEDQIDISYVSVGAQQPGILEINASTSVNSNQ